MATTTESPTPTLLETPLPTSSTASAWFPEVNSSTSSALLTEVVTHVGQLFLAATTERAVQDHDAEDDPEDGQRRQLLIGLICLAVALFLVLVAVGYFFYRVCLKFKKQNRCSSLI